MNVRRLWLAALLPALLAAAAGIATLRFDFVGDDEILILTDPNVRQLSGIPNLFRRDFFDRRVEGLPVAGGIGYYRPLTKSTLAVDWALWGRKPFGFHLSNMVFHVATTLALFALLVALWGRFDLAAYGAAIFAVYPTHPQAVSLINARSDLLCLLGGLIAVWGVVRSRNVAIFLGTALALFSKETGVFVPMLVVLFSWVQWGERRRRAVQTLLSVAAIAFYLIFRGFAIGAAAGGPSAGSLSETIAYAGKSVGVHLLALSGFDLADPTWLAIPASLWSWGVLCAWVGVFAVGALLFWTIRHRSAWGLSVVWLVVGFAPLLAATRIQVPDMQALIPLHLRWTYLPSVGVAIAVALWLRRIHPRVGRFLIAGYAVLALPLFWIRAAEYRDERSIGLGTLERLRRVPLDELPISLQALRLEFEGMEAARRGDTEVAVEILRGAMKRSSGNPRIQGNLGAALLEAGRLDEAIVILQDSLDASKVSTVQGIATFVATDEDMRGRAGRYALLGEAYFRKGANAEATQALRRALDADPTNARHALNLAAAHARSGEFATARSGYTLALKLQPCYPKALQALVDIADITRDPHLRESTQAAQRRCRG